MKWKFKYAKRIYTLSYYIGERERESLKFFFFQFRGRQIEELHAGSNLLFPTWNYNITTHNLQTVDSLFELQEPNF